MAVNEKRYQAGCKIPRPPTRVSWRSRVVLPFVVVVTMTTSLHGEQSVWVSAHEGRPPKAAPAPAPMATLGTVTTTLPTRKDVYDVYRLDQRPARPSAAPADGGESVRIRLPNGGWLDLQLIITINGQPYPFARQQRVKKLIAPDDNSHAVTVPEELKAKTESYLAAKSEEVNPEELGWLLEQWVPGPEFLVYGSTRGYYSATYRPVLRILDHDEDARLSAKEIAASSDSLHKADRNENELLEASELRRYQSGRSDRDAFGNARLATRLSSESARDDQPGKTGHAKKSPDMTVHVMLGDQAERAGAEVMVYDSEVELTADERTRTVQILGWDTRLEIAAINGQLDSDQVSIGLVVEGAPLQRALDRDQDGKLSPREIAGAPDILNDLDFDRDGQLDQLEAKPTLRFAVAWGPIVHHYLQQRTTSSGKSNGTAAIPGWFVSMDRNGDGDLSRAEFPGGDRAFAELDQDGDRLISPAEASQSESK